MITIRSYGTKNGEVEDPAAWVFDCRQIPNPHSKGGLLASMNGTDRRLQTWVMGHDTAQYILESAVRITSRATHPTRANHDTTMDFVCIGGRHRSVTLAEVLHQHLTDRGIPATVNHRDL